MAELDLTLHLGLNVLLFLLPVAVRRLLQDEAFGVLDHTYVLVGYRLGCTRVGERCVCL